MSDSKNSSTPFLSNKAYDLLKWITQILLPGIGALYFGLAGIYGLPNAEQVVGTIVVVDTFLGLLLGVSTQQYNNSDARFDGSISVTESDERQLFSLELDKDPEDLASKDEVLFKVENETTPPKRRRRRPLREEL